MGAKIIKFNKQPYHILIKKYKGNERLLIEIVTEEQHDPTWICTTNIPSIILQEDEVMVFDPPGAEGLIDCLVKNEVLSKEIKRVTVENKDYGIHKVLCLNSVYDCMVY